MKIICAKQRVADLDRLLEAHATPRERHTIERQRYEEKSRLRVFEAVRRWQGISSAGDQPLYC
jgi:hypothetical protein